MYLLNIHLIFFLSKNVDCLRNNVWGIKCFFNTLRPRQDGRHFADDIFTCNFFNENCCILIKFSLKYVRMGPIDINPTLVQIIAWRRSGDRPLSEPMTISLPTHIYASLGLNELISNRKNVENTNFPKFISIDISLANQTGFFVFFHAKCKSCTRLYLVGEIMFLILFVMLMS